MAKAYYYDQESVFKKNSKFSLKNEIAFRASFETCVHLQKASS